MSCPTCSHTMQTVIQGVLWCPRCGTTRLLVPTGESLDSVPKLVERCRAFESQYVHGKSQMVIDWTFLGIYESIRPEGRAA